MPRPAAAAVRPSAAPAEATSSGIQQLLNPEVVECRWFDRHCEVSQRARVLVEARWRDPAARESVDVARAVLGLVDRVYELLECVAEPPLSRAIGRSLYPVTYALCACNWAIAAIDAIEGDPYAWPDMVDSSRLVIDGCLDPQSEEIAALLELTAGESPVA